MCAGNAASFTVITCEFARLPGGEWQMGTLAAAATRGMVAVAANTNNAAHIVRVFGSQHRGSLLMSGAFLVMEWMESVRLAARSPAAICRPRHGVGAIACDERRSLTRAQARARPCPAIADAAVDERARFHQERVSGGLSS